MTAVDIVLHVEGNYKSASNLISEIYKQAKVTISSFIVALTSKHNAEEERFKEFCKKNNIFLFEIEDWYFSSSLTIQRAIRHYAKGDIVVVLNQKIRLLRSDSLYNLVKDIESKKCAFTYGRQVIKHNNLEKYLLNELFPTSPILISKDDFKIIKQEVFMALTMFYALDRNVFLKLDGYQNYEHLLEANTFYMKKLVDNGYILRYCSEALAENPFRLHHRQVYDCYYYLGKFLLEKDNMFLYEDYRKRKMGRVLASRLARHLKFIGVIRVFLYNFTKQRARHKVNKLR